MYFFFVTACDIKTLLTLVIIPNRESLMPNYTVHNINLVFQTLKIENLKEKG